MRPFDPRLVREVRQARSALARLAAVGVVGGVLAIAQAYAVALLTVALVQDRSLSWPAAVLVVTLSLRGVVAALRERTAARAADDVTRAVRRRRIAGWLRRPVEQRPDERTAQALATESVDALEPYVARYLPALVTAAVVPVLVVLTLLLTDWLSALIVLITLPLLPLFAALIGQHTEEAVDRRFAGSVRLAGHFADVVRGLPTLVGYQRAEAQADQVGRVGRQHRRATMGTLRIAFLSSAALELLATLSVALVAVAVGLRIAGGHLPLEAGLLAILLAPEAYWPIRRVGQEFHAAADGAQALSALLDDTPAAATAGQRIVNADSRVRVEKLRYRHPGSDLDVLHELSFDVPGGLTAITGESGCGKTTLLELLAGLRTPTAGVIEAPDSHLVTQRPFLAPASLADNLRLATPDEPVGTLPARLTSVPADVVLGDDGFGLSAGQRAAVALERARRSDDPLLLVDEPTAHLDPDAAAHLIATLRTLAHTRTVLVATHDPALIAAADHTLPLPAREKAHDDHSNGDHDSNEGHEDETADNHDDQPERFPRKAAEPQHWLHPRPGILTAGVLGALAALSGVALTATSGWLIVRASERPVILTLITAIVLVRTFGVTRPALRYVERLRSHDAALTDLVERRISAYRRLIPLTPARLGRRRRADLLTGFVRDLDDVVEAQVRVVVPAVSVAVAGAVAVGVISWLYAPVAIVIVAQLALAGAAAWLSLRLERRDQHIAVARRGAIRRAAHMATANTAGLQATSATAWALEQLDTASAGRVVGSRGRAMMAGAPPLLTGVATAVAAILLAPAIASGSISAPVAALVLLTPLALGEVLDLLLDVVSAGARAAAAQTRIDALLGQEPAVTPSGRRAVHRANGRLTVDDVTTAWDATPIGLPPVTIQPGEHLAVTGPNGCGKSTLLAVLARHLDPLTGSVRLDRRDLRDLDLDDVRRRIAVVDDEPHVFSGSLAANLRLARPEASEHDLDVALRAAGLAAWRRRLPAGLETPLGDDARALSGGEQTRLALARALLSERPVLLLDEPVAHLDQPTARRVLHDLHLAAHGRTVVLVTHHGLGEAGCTRVLRWGSGSAPFPGSDRRRERTAV